LPPLVLFGWNLVYVSECAGKYQITGSNPIFGF
jgi:hypothetical protein